MSGWDFAGESVALGSGTTVTLVQGSSFCICERTGDIRPGGPQGLFVRDTRFCSKLVLTFDGQEAEPLAANTDQPFAASRSEEHTSELQSQSNLVCRLLLEKK